MAMTAWKDSPPAGLLRGLRGEIVDARIAYPDVLHLEARDDLGGIWRLATQDADWHPEDPARLVGRAIVDTRADRSTGELRCLLSDGLCLVVTPTPEEPSEEPLPTWELIAPNGAFLEMRRGRWEIRDADSPAT